MHIPDDEKFEITDEDWLELNKYFKEEDKEDLRQSLEYFHNQNKYLLRKATGTAVTHDRYESAKEILKIAVSSIDNGDKNIDPLILEYLSECFKKILNDDIEAKEAMNLTRPRSRPPENQLKKIRREVFTALSIKELIDKGTPVTEAIKSVASNEMYISYEKARDHYYDYLKRNPS